MPYAFTDPAAYPYQTGGFFLGLDDHGREVGIRSERHLITVAGAGTGKGAALIMPNLKRWPGSCLTVDPKAENATETAAVREAMGQLVGVVDPYEIAKGDAARLRCSINPLAVMNPRSLTIRADLEALGDGLIRRHDPKHAQWDDNAAAMIAGLADFVLATEPPEAQTLLNVRALLLLPEDTLKAVAVAMIGTATPAGLARQAGALLQNKFSNPEGVPAAAFARAMQETGWIDDPAFAKVLGGDTLRPFDLATLKAGTGSLFLCIPPGYLDTRGGFLRLFVRMGLMTMMSDLAAHGGGGRCLFLLDEFHSLGKVDLVAKAAGLMRGYGVQLWPFLQDLGQLTALYGEDEAGTFFGNADAHIFFGNADANTLDYISRSLGNLSADEVGAAPVVPMGGGVSAHGVTGLLTFGNRNPNVQQGAHVLGMLVAGTANAAAQAAARDGQRRLNEWQQKAAMIGRPRVDPSTIRELVGKKDGDKVARSMIVFAKGQDVLKLRLAPHFIERDTKTADDPGPPERPFRLGVLFTLAFGPMLAALLFVATLNLDGPPALAAIVGSYAVGIVVFNRWRRGVPFRNLLK